MIENLKYFLLFALFLAATTINAQEIKIITIDKAQVEATLLNETTKNQLLFQLNGKVNNPLRKKWTARSYQLSNEKILVEFYDGQAMLIKTLDDFKKLERVRFVKNMVDFLKKIYPIK